MVSDRERKRIDEYNEKRKRRWEIIELVQDGRMQPDEANRAAENEGLTPFEETPNAVDFPVMDEASWTIEMAVAWIIWRSPSEIVRYFSPFRENVIYWRPIVRTDKSLVFDLEARPKANLATVKSASGWEYIVPLEGGTDRVVDFAEAMSDLWEKLETGKVNGRAISIESAKPIEIPSFQWNYLEVSRTERGPTELKFTSTFKPEYKNVMFDRSEILMHWPALDNLVQPPHRAIGDDMRLTPTEQDIQNAIENLWPDTSPPASQKQLQKAVGDHLKKHRHYHKSPDPKTYQRYFSKLRIKQTDK